MKKFFSIIYKISLLVACLITIFFSAAIAKDDIALRAYADKNSIFIGDRIKYVIELTAVKGTEAEIPNFKDTNIGEFEVKDSGRSMKERAFGKKTLYSWYYVSIYSAGKKKIPQVEVKYKLSGAKEWSIRKTDAIDINVMSVLPKGIAITDIKDIKGPFYCREIPWFLIFSAILALVICVSIFGIYRKIRQRRPIRFPHETALEELEASRSDFLKAGDVKEYFAGISDCVRRYIERVFRLKAPEMTTEEFLNSLRGSSVLSVSQKESLKGFLSACDLVKFAKYAPTRPETDNVYTTAKGFVEETKEIFILRDAKIAPLRARIGKRRSG